MRHPHRNAGERAVWLRDDHQHNAAVLELSLDQHSLAAAQMEPIVDPPFNQMFVGSMSRSRAGLYDAGVDAVLDQPRRVGMAQSVRGYPALYACRTDGGGEGARQHAVIELRVTEMAGEQPAAVVGSATSGQLIENRLWQRQEPLLVALADDTQHLVGPGRRRQFPARWLR